jgi:alcohol dehydrogenase class IV
MLPAVMRWNEPVNTDRQALVSVAMGRPGANAATMLDAFIGGLGMPRSLAAVNIGREHFPKIAEQAMGTPWVPRNPRPIKGPADIREILDLAA